MGRKTALGFLFVAAAAGLGLYFSRGPWITYRQQREKADSATQEMLKHEREKSVLEQQKALLDSPIHMEERVREQRYLKPNEQPVNGRS